MIKLNNELVIPTIFPDKTSQIWQIDKIKFQAEEFDINWIFENESEIFHLLQLVTLIRHENSLATINLHVPFLPYSRQDKRISNNSTWALHCFAQIINSMNFDKVTSVDVHNKNVTQKLINNFKNINPEPYIYQVLSHFDKKDLVIIFPDASAEKRYSHYSCFYLLKTATGIKQRNPLNGLFTHYYIEAEVSDKNCLIIDDICDGGGTFKILAASVQPQNPRSINLYVTHGIFSRGLETLRDAGISKIFTNNGEIF